MAVLTLRRPPEALFEPVKSEPLTHPISLMETAKRMRVNPMAILPDLLFTQTRVSGPYLGRSVHEISGPLEMKTVLQDEYEVWRKSPLILRMLRPVLGDSILTAHGESWRRQRMTMQPAFLKRRLDKFAPIMTEAADAAVAALSALSGPVEVHAVMNDTTFAVIERALFSDVEGFDRAQVREAIEVLLEEIGRMRYSDLIPFPDWTPRLLSGDARRARRVFRTAAQGQIERRRAMEDPGDDLLGLLLKVRNEETGEGLSDEDVRDTVMTFIAAGHETTAIALTWALYLLAHDQDCQAALRAEADQVLGGERAEARHVSELKLARQVIDETLRLYPPAPILGRRATAETEICGHPVRKGDVALLAFYALHRHETLWEHPDLFDPDRFSQERRPTDRYSFLPFGGGPRACIGSQFSLMEAVLVLSTIVSKLTFTPAHGTITPVMQVTLRPEEGMHLKFETC